MCDIPSALFLYNDKELLESYYKISETYTVKFRCHDDNVIVHTSRDLAIIDAGRKLANSYPIAIPSGAEEQPMSGDYVYAVGWGRACNDPGKACNNQDRRPDHMQVFELISSINSF